MLFNVLLSFDKAILLENVKYVTLHIVLILKTFDYYLKVVVNYLLHHFEQNVFMFIIIFHNDITLLYHD